MSKIVVAVSGMNAVDSPGPGVPVIRSLKESTLNLELIGFAYGTLEPGNFMLDLVENSFLLPYPSSGHEVLLERIQYIHSLKKLNVIIPTLDSELDNYISIIPELNKMGIQIFLPGRKELHTRDKTYLKESLANTDVLLPETFTVQDVGGIRHVTDELGFPLFVKGVFYEAYLARNYEEAVGYFYAMAGKWGIPVIFQKYISGEECNVCALAKDGEMIGAVVMKKLFLTDKGKAWAGVTIKNEKVEQISKKILKFINWNSGCELEYIIENKTGKMYLLEINPRFPAWVYLATASGQNLPEALLKLSLGESVTPFESYEVGKVFVRHSWDEIIPMKYIESLTVKGQLKDIEKGDNNE